MIPEFLKPPTDNLYKFITICGLVLFLISITYPPWLYHRSAMASLSAESDSEMLQLEIKDLNRKRDQFIAAIKKETAESETQGARVKELTEQVSDGKLSAKERDKINKEVEDMNSKHEASRKESQRLSQLEDDAIDKVQRAAVELEYKVRINLWENRYGKVALIFCMVGSAIGLLIGRKGFNLWSLRVQVHQDAILRKQAEAFEPHEKTQV